MEYSRLMNKYIEAWALSEGQVPNGTDLLLLHFEENRERRVCKIKEWIRSDKTKFKDPEKEIIARTLEIMFEVMNAFQTHTLLNTCMCFSIV